MAEEKINDVKKEEPVNVDIKTEAKDNSIHEVKKEHVQVHEHIEKPDESELIEQRTKKLKEIVTKRWLWTGAILILALILGVFIRSLPMQDHNPGVPGNQPGLWDVAENDWTLGPDLDPWVFYRTAKTAIIEGKIPDMDNMRNVPIGFDNSIELQMVPQMIIYTYKFINIFGDYSPMFAAIIMPVLFFALTIIAFFLFVREIFVKEDEKSKTKANIISLIATFFMIVIPVFLSRTIAGIPEKESIAFFFMFIAFFFFLKAWKTKSPKMYILLSVLAGVSAAVMNLAWGGALYIYVSIAGATLIAFLLNKVKERESYIFVIWMVTALIVLNVFTNRYTLTAFFTGSSTIVVTLVLAILIVNFILNKTKVSDKLSKKFKLPSNIISIIVAIIVLLIGLTIVSGPFAIFDKFNSVYEMMFKVIEGRWIITVAENRQPFYNEWASSFGPYIQQLPNLPVMFWLFFAGSVFLLFKTLKDNIKKWDAIVLTILYVLFFLGLVFSRYAPSHILNGSNFISRFVYIGGALLLILGFLYYYMIYQKRNHHGFEKIDYNVIFLLVLFVICLFTARSAIRLVMVLGPISTIMVAYLIVGSIDAFRKSRDETIKIIIGAFMVLILILSVFTFYTYYNTVKNQAYSFIPGPYNFQWQKAMKWVRDETPKESVFAHWWDYGYWVQSIGERATITDGGNAAVYWNYLSGRHVLTGDNQKDSLEFLYNHDVNYLLIDSTDIGKYGAFSSIGSDINYDRYSWIGSFLLDETQIQETKDQTLLVFTGGIALDEDTMIEQDGKEIILPSGKTGVGAMILPVENDNGTEKFVQPIVVMQYNGVIHRIPMRYLSIDGEFVDFETGIEGAMMVFPRLISDGQSVSQNKAGAAIFVSPRILRGFLGQKYLLDDPFDKFPNFQVAHNQPSLVVENLRQQGMVLPDIVHFNGIQGPIKIWSVEYTGEEEERYDYIDTDHSKYINWTL
ncbi:hypothetical protein GOV12_04065 [Candidatus Pacearchaeota archaeon]|nr:hypothetical protein [Candidatus Pacearchaeota archaeon]